MMALHLMHGNAHYTMATHTTVCSINCMYTSKHICTLHICVIIKATNKLPVNIPVCMHAAGVELYPGLLLYKSGDAADSFYMVVDGSIHLLDERDHDEGKHALTHMNSLLQLSVCPVCPSWTSVCNHVRTYVTVQLYATCTGDLSLSRSGHKLTSVNCFTSHQKTFGMSYFSACIHRSEVHPGSAECMCRSYSSHI